ncbi:type II secretion system protein [Romboutsia ilealis]|uniref:type II secretion system protein n=1 Tax=Romboutsia ilealis TaxID=1115758 RepID=UPI0026757396|nr:prepilin-type N-terminal cleavage/methylation domain-containing protein [Romboutsia ilealis]
MIKKNNKGFTLLELLISIFILTTVIFIGYRVINKSTIDIKNQSNINKGQLTMNDMNEYLTKDLEKASNVAISSNFVNNILTEEEKKDLLTNEKVKEGLYEYINKSLQDDFDYTYKIFFKEEKEENISATYKVNITKKEENNYNYTIKRIDETDGVSMTFINNEIIKEDEMLKKEDSMNIEVELPFEISLNSPYEVSLGYNGKNNEFVRHQFIVDYRLDLLPPRIDDIIPPNDWENFNTIGFWTADSKKKTQDNLYTWVSSETAIIEDAYADQEDGKNDEFNIEGYVKYDNDTFTGSYIGYDEIDSDKNWKGQVNDISIGSKKIINIDIYVSKETTLKDFKIESDEAKITIDKKTLKSSDGIDLETGWHSCTIELNKDSLLNFKFTGKLSIDKSKVSSGYAYVAYQKEDYSIPEIKPPENIPEGSPSDLHGDIIFDFYNKLHNNNKIETFANKIQSNIVNSTSEQTVDAWLSNNTEDLRVFIYGHENKMAVSVQGREMSLYNEKFKNITGMIFSVSGNIKLKNFQIEFEPQHGGYKKETIEIELDKSTNTYTFDFLNYLDYANLKVTKLSCKLDVNDMKNSGNIDDKAQVKVDFIYK